MANKTKPTKAATKTPTPIRPGAPEEVPAPQVPIVAVPYLFNEQLLKLLQQIVRWQEVQFQALGEIYDVLKGDTNTEEE